MQPSTKEKVRKTYRGWMRLKKPVPPKSTKYDNLEEYVNKEIPHPVVSTVYTGTRPTSEEREMGEASNTQSGEEELNDSYVNALSPVRNDVGSPSRSRSASLNQSHNFMDTCESNADSNQCSCCMGTDSISHWSSHSSLQSACSVTSADNTHQDEEGSHNEPNLKFSERIDMLDEPILPNLKTTKFEVLLLVLNFSLRHGLTDVARGDMCVLINQILETNCIPSDTYWFKKVFGTITFSLHFYCSSCGCYICELSNEKPRTDILDCPLETCKTRCNLSTLNDGHFFITLPVKEQLQYLLETTENAEDLLNYRWNERDNDVISDIFDGAVYKELSKSPNILSEKFNLSITFNTDGARVFKSCKNTLWPIHFRINEFPPNVRFNQNNNLIAGLWFGSCDPDMALFLSPFVQELQSLHSHGFDWMASPSNQVNSKVILLQCVLDSVAKPKVQKIHQFNGAWACGYCLHPGVVLDNIPSNQAKYLMNRDACLYDDFSVHYTVQKYDATTKTVKTFCVEDRKDWSMRSDMAEAEALRAESSRVNLESIHVRGLKGLSPLFPLLYFDLVFGFGIDYLHGILLGVCRTVACLWLDEDSYFYVGDRVVALMEKRLATITPPSSISRRPRPLSERIHWKGNEWRSWLLYYSVPCSVGCLPSSYFKHHCLLVNATFILLKDKITKDDLTEVGKNLVQYVADFQRIYGQPNMFYNVHLLLHVTKLVSLYGPLWCYSAFSFESANGVLVKLVKGTRGVVSQIAQKYSVCRLMTNTLSLYKVRSDVMQFCDDLLCYRVCAISNKVGTVTVLGPSKFKSLSFDEQKALEDGGVPISNYSHERLIKGGVMYHGRCYVRRGKKSDDSAVKLTNGTHAVIERILVTQTNRSKSVNLLLRLIMTEPRAFTHASGIKVKHLKQCSPIVFGSLFLTNAEDIVCKVVFMRCMTDTYVCTFPNIYEKD